jgi:hypothetical protein
MKIELRATLIAYDWLAGYDTSEPTPIINFSLGAVIRVVSREVWIMPADRALMSVGKKDAHHCHNRGSHEYTDAHYYERHKWLKQKCHNKEQ